MTEFEISNRDIQNLLSLNSDQSLIIKLNAEIEAPKEMYMVPEKYKISKANVTVKFDPKSVSEFVDQKAG